MYLRASQRLATAVSPRQIQKGSVVKHENKYVEITSSKSNPVGTQFEFIDLSDRNIKGKFRVKSYDTIELVNEEFSVEVERLDKDNNCLLTTTNTYERINVPITLLPEGPVPEPGSKLAILTDEGQFVRLKMKAASSTPKWQL